ncbi:MAG TPA: hypothetical protein PLZ51_26225, partial [Aggregatilineales bacterium]|nr:hypothetical protein [Aggregatilineales bacterium]
MPDGHILSWSWDKTLRLWDNDGNLLKTMTGHTRAVNGAILLQNGHILSWSDKMFCLWDGEGNLI